MNDRQVARWYIRIKQPVCVIFVLGICLLPVIPFVFGALSFIGYLCHYGDKMNRGYDPMYNIKTIGTYFYISTRNNILGIVGYIVSNQVFGLTYGRTPEAQADAIYVVITIHIVFIFLTAFATLIGAYPYLEKLRKEYIKTNGEM